MARIDWMAAIEQAKDSLDNAVAKNINGNTGEAHADMCAALDALTEVVEAIEADRI